METRRVCTFSLAQLTLSNAKNDQQLSRLALAAVSLVNKELAEELVEDGGTEEEQQIPGPETSGRP